MTSPAAPSKVSNQETPPESPTKVPAATSRAGAPVKPAAEVIKALQAALAAEQVAVWAYDLVAAYDQADADIISRVREGHLARREATAGLLVGAGAKAPAPAPSYTLPEPVTDVAGARALGDVLESDCAASWRAVIGSADDANLRAMALAGLSDSAVWLTQLKIAAKASPVTVALPGQG